MLTSEVLLMKMPHLPLITRPGQATLIAKNPVLKVGPANRIAVCSPALYFHS